MVYFKNKEWLLHEYKSDLALVRKLQLPFKFSNVRALIWDTQNVTLRLMHISALITRRARSSATTAPLVWQGRSPVPHRREALICSHPWQPTGSVSHPLSFGATVLPLVEEASQGMGQASCIDPEQSCLASSSRGSRVGTTQTRSAWISSGRRYSSEGRLEDGERSFPFPHFVPVLFWLTSWQRSVNYKGRILKRLVLCIDIYVRKTWVLRRYKKLSNQYGSLLYPRAEMQMICKAAGNQTSMPYYRCEGYKIGCTEQTLLTEPLQCLPALFPFSQCVCVLFVFQESDTTSLNKAGIVCDTELTFSLYFCWMTVLIMRPSLTGSCWLNNVGKKIDAAYLISLHPVLALWIRK